MTGESERFETIVIGAGQAGLATGYHLQRRGRPFVILDADERTGDSWRSRWPSLKLYSPARYDSLPGMRFPGRGAGFPSAGEMADYLEAYAARFELPIRHGIRIDALTGDDGGFVATAGDRRFEADNVVVATGVMQAPVVPEFAGELGPQVRQLHSSEYRSPVQLQEGAVLVVGAAHSGGDIAHEVARAGHQTILAGRSTGQLPFSVESRRARVGWPVAKFLATKVLTVDTPIGRKARPELRGHGGPLLRIRSKDLEAAGVERVFERIGGVRDVLPVADGGRVFDVPNVVWCTGFRPDYGWIDLPLEEEDGFPRQYKGAVAGHPGLYFVGMLFLHSFSSMLVLGAGRDGKRVADQIAARRQGRDGVLVWNGQVARPQRTPS